MPTNPAPVRPARPKSRPDWATMFYVLAFVLAAGTVLAGILVGNAYATLKFGDFGDKQFNIGAAFGVWVSGGLQAALFLGLGYAIGLLEHLRFGPK
jgi:hypothetical protein